MKEETLIDFTDNYLRTGYILAIGIFIKWLIEVIDYWSIIPSIILFILAYYIFTYKKKEQEQDK